MKCDIEQPFSTKKKGKMGITMPPNQPQCWKSRAVIFTDNRPTDMREIRALFHNIVINYKRQRSMTILLRANQM